MLSFLRLLCCLLTYLKVWCEQYPHYQFINNLIIHAFSCTNEKWKMFWLSIFMPVRLRLFLENFVQLWTTQRFTFVIFKKIRLCISLVLCKTRKNIFCLLRSRCFHNQLNKNAYRFIPSLLFLCVMNFVCTRRVF